MKRYLTSTAVLLALGTAAYANPFASTNIAEMDNLWASDLIGKRVYVSEAELNMEAADARIAEKEWNDIGEIDDLVLSRSGDVRSVIIGVGGLMGIGEKDVAVDMSEITFISDGEDANDYFLVVNASVADVEEAPAYERSWTDVSAEMPKVDETMDKAGAEIEHAGTDLANGAEEVKDDAVAMAKDAGAAVESAADGVVPTSEQLQIVAPWVDRDGYTNVVATDLNTEDLTGARVYGINDEDVGEISELLLTKDGKIDRAVIDVGGFLGLGEHPVALSMDELKIMTPEDGSYFRVYIDSTEDALERLPAYTG